MVNSKITQQKSPFCCTKNEKNIVLQWFRFSPLAIPLDPKNHMEQWRDFTPQNMGKNTGKQTPKNGRFWVSHGLLLADLPRRRTMMATRPFTWQPGWDMLGASDGFFTPIDVAGPGPIFFKGGFLFKHKVFFKQNGMFIHMFVCCLVFFVGHTYIYIIWFSTQKIPIYMNELGLIFEHQVLDSWTA